MSSSDRSAIPVSVVDIGVRYRSAARPVLDAFSADIPDGATTAVVGPSGTGKSTLLYAVGLLLQIDRGQLTLAGSDTSSWSDAQRSHVRARHIGFVFQDASLDPARSSLENVAESLHYAGLDWRSARRQARSSLDRFGVGRLAGRKAANLSGGEAQRVGLARALAKRPGLVLADEPTGSLDRGNADTVFDALKEESLSGAAIMVVTHDRALADRCDNIIRLEGTA
ncbi:MAG: ATP-binding cassette domain-containing protein [Actinomycetia bacterium]|nr:ATP-binding cassette domain-containing protein [Actinomycetes bacterium]